MPSMYLDGIGGCHVMNLTASRQRDELFLGRMQRKMLSDYYTDSSIQSQTSREKC
jgi:hypothetical protein